MDAQLTLKARPTVIGSASDFTYKWAVNIGLTQIDATRLALAVDELVADIVQFAYPHDEEGTFDILFRHDMSRVEVTLFETGEPFDPDRHPYDRDRAMITGNFEGAGLELVRHLVDDFIFLNKGKGGKEFRLSKEIVSEHIVDILPESELRRNEPATLQGGYVLSPLKLEDAEDIAKLIYRNYGYSYPKEELYHPKKIELAMVRKEKFGVMVRTSAGEPVGYFAVMRSTDSMIGEVGEAVVSPQHRRRGLMKRMLEALIEMAQSSDMYALFGQAITVHTISQQVNQHFNFVSCALLLAEAPPVRFRAINEEYPQALSEMIEMRILQPIDIRKVYLPGRYKTILRKIYRQLGLTISEQKPNLERPAGSTLLDVDIDYEDQTADLIVRRYGNDLTIILDELLPSLREKSCNAVYLDLPLHSQETAIVVDELHELGFIFSGLMPLMHRSQDYLRMQLPFTRLDMDLIHVWSELGKAIKDLITEELYALYYVEK